MIPVFRKIRKKMADDNRPIKYARYAIGEIVLVVIGILIALQINNWNEEKKINREVNEYLTNLLTEFKTNQEVLKSDMESHKFVSIKTKELSDLISPNPKEITSNKLDTLMFAVMFYPEFTALTTLMTSDKLERVNDYELKNDIANWKLNYEEYRYDLKISYDQYMNHTYEFVAENYQIKNVKHIIRDRIKIDKSLFPVDARSILSNPVFENQMKLRSLNAKFMYQGALKLYELQEDLIKSIELKIQNEN